MSVALHFILLPREDFGHPMKERTINDEFDFTIRVPRSVTGRIDGAEIHTVVPPHDLGNDQISI